jgi:hypothetical protein
MAFETSEIVSLEEIEALARQESVRQRDFFVGVEHLFIALTRLNGVVRDVLATLQASPDYLRDQIRQVAGGGDVVRFDVDPPLTPRARVIMEAAQRLVREKDEDVPERALLFAIIDEGDNLPLRVLSAKGIHPEELREQVLGWSQETRAYIPLPEVIQGAGLDDEQQTIVQRMFRGYAQVQIERMLTEGTNSYSGSTVMLVKPIHADGRTDLLVVVKLFDRQSILWEKKRYDKYVHDRLPAKAARITADPMLPDNSRLGGLKYTFIRGLNDTAPVNLGQYIREHDGQATAAFLRDKLYAGFKETWWGQRQQYHFEAWKEYDLVLPPALTVEASDRPARYTLTPGSDLTRAMVGDVVSLDGFFVTQIKRATNDLQLAMGPETAAVNYTNRVKVRGLDLDSQPHYRGQIIESLTVRVTGTRADMLQEYVQRIEPDFNVMAERIPIGPDGESAPNPLRHYQKLLSKQVLGTVSTIHGDLHIGNVLVGEDRDAYLIDFEWARDGHTLFDWAVLETSILIDHVAGKIGDDWASARRTVGLIGQLNEGEQIDPGDPLADGLRGVRAVREIVQELLSDARNWSEYFVPLALCALRVVSWTNRSLGARRLAYLASALAVGKGEQAYQVYLQTSSDVTIDQTR